MCTLAPREPAALHRLGYLAFQLGRHTQAIELLERAIALKPGLAERITTLASAMLFYSDSQRAIACFRKAIELDRNSCKSRMRTSPARCSSAAIRNLAIDSVQHAIGPGCNQRAKPSWVLANALSRSRPTRSGHRRGTRKPCRFKLIWMMPTFASPCRSFCRAILRDGPTMKPAGPKARRGLQDV